MDRVAITKLLDEGDESWETGELEAAHIAYARALELWIEPEERQRVLDFHPRNPLEGYRRLTFMMLDQDVVAVSPSTTYRVIEDIDDPAIPIAQTCEALGVSRATVSRGTTPPRPPSYATRAPNPRRPGEALLRG